MPPEPLPWDRKDLFKDRKHERPDSHHHHHHHPVGGGGGGYGGAGGFGSASRWREPPHPHPQPYYGSPRWSSDFRYRPPGYGKQGGRHIYSEESSHGFAPSRPVERIPERMSDDEGSRASGTGKYIRNRDYRGNKDSKGQSWEVSPSPNGPGRPNGIAEQRRSFDDIVNSSLPQLEFTNTGDHAHVKEQHEKSGGMNLSGSSGQRLERENSLGSIDWKPLKWTRSGSLSSRGSGFSHSSSSKSLGVDSSELKVELLPSNLSPVQSPSVDAVLAPAPREVSAAPSDETSSRKKPRLGWGEGLAKFEKKKVEPVDDSAANNGTVCFSISREPLQVPHSTFEADKSPTINGFSDCASPATPSSVGCSSSPGLEEKQSTKSVHHTDQDTSNMSLSPGIVFHNQIVGPTFDLENLDLAQSGRLSSAINNLLQSEDPSTVDSGYVNSTAINKLLVWKDDVLKKLEVTEGEIDRLEVELKSLMVLPENSFLHTAASSSLPAVTLSIPQEQDATSNTTHRLAPLELVSSRDHDRERIPDVQEDDRAEVKHEEVDSPGSATSKFVEVSLGKDMFPSDKEADVKGPSNTDMDKSMNIYLKIDNAVHEESGDKVSAFSDVFELVSSCPTHVDEFHLFGDGDHNICESILASNKECANRADEVFNKLLPTGPFSFEISNFSMGSSGNDSLAKEMFLRRKHSVQFKERLFSLKFMALQYLWKEDIRTLSMRKFRVKSHKKFDPSMRTVCSSSLKQRSSTIRLRLPSTAGILSSVPNNELNNYLTMLLSDCNVKPCRNFLKMPALILDKKEKMATRFISSNGLVEDPCAAEKERSMINPWTSEEKEIFMDKFTAYGKDFSKVASFLVHKTTADCIEFYYKNHKCDWFQKTKKHPSLSKQGKMHSANNYLVASGKRWNCEANTGSLDILGAASVIAANADNGLEFQQRCSSNYLLGRSSDHKKSKGDNGLPERSSSLDVDSSERETVAADVLAGICGSLSSEAMSSCITSAVEAGENYHEMKSQRMGSFGRWSLTAEMTQSAEDETCSDESCGEADHADWTDEEKSSFIQAVSSYGKDFTMISRCMRTRSRDQCKVFFSKARKCLGLDLIFSGSSNVARDDGNGGGNDADDACVVETDSVICSEKSGDKMEIELPSPGTKLHSEPDLVVASAKDLNQFEENNERGELDSVETELRSKNAVDLSQVCDKPTHQSDRDGNDDGEIRSCSSSEPVAVQEQGSVSISIVEVEPCAQADISDAPDDRVHAEKLAEHADARSPGVVSMEIVRNEVEEKMSANSLDLDLSSAGQVSDNSRNGASGNQSSICGGLTENQKLSELQFVSSAVSVSVKNPCNLQLQQKSFPVPMNLVPQQVSAVKCGEIPSKASPSFPPVMKINGEQDHQAVRVGQKLLSESSFLSTFGSSHVLYPVPATSIGDAKSESNIRTVTFQRKLDNPQDQLLGCEAFLQKCNGFKSQSSGAELPFRPLEQVGDTNHSYKSNSSLDAEKHRQNGDVKLFGQILSKPSSQQKSVSGAQRNSDSENQLCVMGKQLSPRFFCDQAVNGSISQTKLEQHNLLSPENHPLRRYWDDNRVQTGFSSLPNSALLLAKYPDAFGSYAVHSSNMEHLQLNSMISSERSLNRGAVFQGREIGSSNAAADYPSYRSRELQRHDVVLSEIQRRNGDVNGVQPGARGLVAVNGRRGVLVGSPCTGVGVSDPVAAIKMLYSNANGEQMNGGPPGSIIREEDSWRGKGNVGR